MKSQKLKVAIYSRVSTEEQAKEGLSVDAQIEKCKSFCNARDWEIFKIYKDAGYSAGSLKRPALELLLRDAQEKKFDIILVYKIDRFSRKLRDLILVLEELKEQGINFTSVTEQIDTTSAMGEAFFQIIGVFAQLERGMIKERVELAFDRKIQFGEAVHRAPFGYKYQNKKLVPDTENAFKVKEIFEMWSSGINYREISKKFNLPPSTLYQIIKNPLYIGKIKYKKKLYRGKHPALIDEELFHSINSKEKISKLKQENQDTHDSADKNSP